MDAGPELSGQVFAFGEKSGISPDMLGLVMGAFFGQPALQEYARLIRRRSFGDPGSTLSRRRGMSVTVCHFNGI